MEIRYYTDDIVKFIFGLNPKTQAKVDDLLLLLGEYENNLKMPYSKALGSGLFELRIRGQKQARIIYCFHNNFVILLHIFVKKQSSILRKDLDIAKNRKRTLA